MRSGSTDRPEEPPAILVVDDAEDNRRIAGAILRAAGWRVDEAGNGRDAIVAIGEREYALVLLDIQMPGLDGYRTAEAMRGAPGQGGNVPILAFTALRDPTSVERALAAGMDGHIAKPFTPAALVGAVKPWWPGGEAEYAAVDRLAAVFGPAEIAALLDRLAEQLDDALALAPGAPTLRGEAHRLAGLAGTLGFATLSRAWLEVSEGGESGLATARVETRKALAELARRAESGRQG